MLSGHSPFLLPRPARPPGIFMAAVLAAVALGVTALGSAVATAASPADTAASPAAPAAAAPTAATATPVPRPESPATHTPRTTVTLISASSSVAPGQTLRLGLRQKLAPHWHTYWKNPGDAGAPPTVTLALPDADEEHPANIQWPGPDRLPYGPLVNFGYEDEIVFPFTVTVPDTLAAGQTFSVRADATWLVCERECIPEEGSYRLDLPVTGSATPAGGDVAAAFALADARMPAASPWQAVVSAEGEALAMVLEGEGLSPATIEQAFFFPEAWGAIEHAGAQNLSVEEGRLTLAMVRGPALDESAPLSGLVQLRDAQGRTRWLEVAAPIGARAGGAGSRAGDAAQGYGTNAVPAAGSATQPEASAPSQAPAGLPGWQAALFAFLGGLILNLMPCVFPVLAMKATSVARLAGGALREVRMAGLFYTLGVLAAFAVLAGALLAVRAGGAAVGWGFQFQAPWFVAGMAWLLLAIGLNLSGVFEAGARLAGSGQSLAQQPGHRGSFFTGLLAVVVATPCTAPFMGAALGAALSAPAPVALGLFLAMGLGLALPYALLAVFPGCARWLPRPGPWMVRLRQGMAFPMYGSAAWLVWVLSQQAGSLGVMVGLAGAVLVGLAAWLYGVAQQGARRRWLPAGAAAAALAATLAMLPGLDGLDGALAPQATAASAAGSAAATPRTTGFEPYTPARLAALREQGRPVFVNMTAAWCITCLVNERTVLATDAIRSAMADAGVAYLKGDWTNRDPDITAFLRSFSRDGLPFYVFYPGGNADPVVLPPVLTEGTVTSAFARAAPG